MRNIPFFILVDASGKMAGEKIKFFNVWLKGLINEFRADPYSLEVIEVFIASFNNQVNKISSLAPVSLINNFNVHAKPSSPAMLGNALEYMIEKLQKLNFNDEFHRKYIMPKLIIMTGGIPSDPYSFLNSIEQLSKKWNLDIIIGLSSSELFNTYKTFLKNSYITNKPALVDLRKLDPSYLINSLYEHIEADASDHSQMYATSKTLKLDNSKF